MPPFMKNLLWWLGFAVVVIIVLPIAFTGVRWIMGFANSLSGGQQQMMGQDGVYYVMPPNGQQPQQWQGGMQQGGQMPMQQQGSPWQQIGGGGLQGCCEEWYRRCCPPMQQQQCVQPPVVMQAPAVQYQQPPPQYFCPPPKQQCFNPFTFVLNIVGGGGGCAPVAQFRQGGSVGCAQPQSYAPYCPPSVPQSCDVWGGSANLGAAVSAGRHRGR